MTKTLRNLALAALMLALAVPGVASAGELMTKPELLEYVRGIVAEQTVAGHLDLIEVDDVEIIKVVKDSPRNGDVMHFRLYVTYKRDAQAYLNELWRQSTSDEERMELHRYTGVLRRLLGDGREGQTKQLPASFYVQRLPGEQEWIPEDELVRDL